MLIKLKRGTDSQIQSDTMQIGEPAFATDTKELYIYDGVSKNKTGKVLSDTFINRPTAEVAGRLFYATDTDVLYLDNGSSWDTIKGLSTLHYGGSFSSSTTWTVNHNLGTSNVIVETYDSSNKKIIPDDIEITSDNQVVVTFNTATAGKVVVAGAVTDYVQTSNPNILVNTDFTNPINQRGLDLTTGAVVTNETYTIDRWQVLHNLTTATMSANTDGLRLTYTTLGAGDYIALKQTSEASYVGKTVTLSAKIRANRNIDYAVRATDGAYFIDLNYTGNGSWQTLTGTGTGTNVSDLRVLLFNNNYAQAAGDWWEIEWVKLEEGSVSTTWTVPDPEIELYRCGEPDDSSTYGYRSTRDIITRPNILINSDFTNPINQRGITSSTVLSNGDYTIDRWKVWFDGAGSDCDCDPTSYTGTRYTATLTGTGQTYYQVGQYDEAYEQYKGKTVTLSVRVKASSASPARLRISDGITSPAVNITADGTYREYVHTYAVSGSASTLLAYIVMEAPSSGDYIEIEWIKLEEGSVATTWTVPDPQQELARCQRYYERSYVLTNATIATGRAANATDAEFAIFHTPKRTAAWTLDNSTLSLLRLLDDSATHIVTGLSLVGRTSNSTTVSVEATSASFTVGELVQFQFRGPGAYIGFDAEL